MYDLMHATGTAHDFDFLFGDWSVLNRRLRRRLVGSGEWEEFAAEMVARPLLDGMGNEDEFRTDHDGGMIGMSFRFFDPRTRLWTIYWADSRRCWSPRSAGRGLVRRRRRDVRGRRHASGQAGPRALHLVADRCARAALGAGVLRRRRSDLGDELGHGAVAGR